MSPTTEQLLQASLALPDAERLELVDALLAAPDPSNEPPFDTVRLVEIRRRSAEIASGSIKANAWPAVRDSVRQRLEGCSRG